jgi:hypothetical protein
MSLFVGIRRFANGNGRRRRKIERTRLFEVEIYDGARGLRTSPDIMDALIELRDAAPSHRHSPANAADETRTRARGRPHLPNTRGEFFGMVQPVFRYSFARTRNRTSPARPAQMIRRTRARRATGTRGRPPGSEHPPCLERAHVSVGRARGIANSSKKTPAPLPGRPDRA